MSAFPATLPDPPAAPPKGRAALAFGLSLGVHVLFFGLLAWSMRGEQRPIVIPVELVFGSAAPAPDARPPESTPDPRAADAAPLAETESPGPDAASSVRRAPPAPSLALVAPRAVRPEPMSPPRTGARPVLPAPVRPPALAGARTRTADAMLELEVHDWLRRHQHYPRAARRAGLEGTAHVRFVIDRSGTLRERELVASSGHAVLDRAALDLLERAAPYPALPRRVTVEAIELTLPVEYRLSGDATRG